MGVSLRDIRLGEVCFHWSSKYSLQIQELLFNGRFFATDLMNPHSEQNTVFQW